MGRTMRFHEGAALDAQLEMQDELRYAELEAEEEPEEDQPIAQQFIDENGDVSYRNLAGVLIPDTEVGRRYVIVTLEGQVVTLEGQVLSAEPVEEEEHPGSVLVEEDMQVEELLQYVEEIGAEGSDDVWVLRRTAHHVFYYNERTREVVWHLPAGARWKEDEDEDPSEEEDAEDTLEASEARRNFYGLDSEDCSEEEEEEDSGEEVDDSEDSQEDAADPSGADGVEAIAADPPSISSISSPPALAVATPPAPAPSVSCPTRSSRSFGLCAKRNMPESEKDQLNPEEASVGQSKKHKSS